MLQPQAGFTAVLEERTQTELFPAKCPSDWAPLQTRCNKAAKVGNRPPDDRQQHDDHNESDYSSARDGCSRLQSNCLTECKTTLDCTTSNSSCSCTPLCHTWTAQWPQQSPATTIYCRCEHCQHSLGKGRTTMCCTYHINITAQPHKQPGPTYTTQLAAKPTAC